MLVVATWVANVVLHVADDAVLPVHYVKGAVATYLDVYRPEILVTGNDDGLYLPAHMIGAGGGNLVLQYTEKPDGIADQQIAAVFLGKVRAGDLAESGYGAYALPV